MPVGGCETTEILRRVAAAAKRSTPGIVQLHLVYSDGRAAVKHGPPEMAAGPCLRAALCTPYFAQGLFLYCSPSLLRARAARPALPTVFHSSARLARASAWVSGTVK